MKIKKLEKELTESLELLKDTQKLIENQGILLQFSNKPLPKTPSRFKLFKEKVKTKFNQLQQLAKKAKVQKQEFVAQVEIKVN